MGVGIHTGLKKALLSGVIPSSAASNERVSNVLALPHLGYLDAFVFQFQNPSCGTWHVLLDEVV